MSEELKTAALEDHQRVLATILCEFDRVCKILGLKYTLFAGTLLGAVRHKGFIPWDDDLDVLMPREDYERLLQEADKILDTEKFYLQGEFSDHWPMFFSKLRANGTACLEKFHPKDKAQHQGIYIDIFPCDNAASTAIGRKIQFAASKVVIAKSLYRRGYETASVKKKIFMQICRFLPGRLFLAIAKKGKKNGNTVHTFFAAARNYEKNVFPREFFSEMTEGEFDGSMYPIPKNYDRLLSALYGEYMVLPPEGERKKKVHAIFVDTANSYEKYAELRDGMEFDVLTESIR